VKHIAPQFELPGGADAFNLSGEILIEHPDMFKSAKATPEFMAQFFPPSEIQQTNARLKFAIACHRIQQDEASRSEIYDAINARYAMRHAELTPAETESFRLKYLRENAPDLIH
jgi:hypothetical protein